MFVCECIFFLFMKGGSLVGSLSYTLKIWIIGLVGLMMNVPCYKPHQLGDQINNNRMTLDPSLSEGLRS